MIPCYKSTKLVLDKILVITLLIALSPLWLILTMLVYLDQGQVLFIQKRPGLLEKPFNLLKFKTMKDGDQPDIERLTRLGHWLRKHSLDELPQLWNVLKGDMSLIGPRPYLMEYLALYTDDHRKRHWVLPGITGWTQVKGGNTLSWQEKLDLDGYYVENMSFWLDLAIFIKTLWLLIAGRKSAIPAKKFIGYKEETT